MIGVLHRCNLRFTARKLIAEAHGCGLVLDDDIVRAITAAPRLLK